MSRMVSGIYHHGNADAPEGSEARWRNQEAFQVAWQKMGLFVIYPDAIGNDFDRQMVINLAEKHYLKRGTS